MQESHMEPKRAPIGRLHARTRPQGSHWSRKKDISSHGANSLFRLCYALRVVGQLFLSWVFVHGHGYSRPEAAYCNIGSVERAPWHYSSSDSSLSSSSLESAPVGDPPWLAPAAPAPPENCESCFCRVLILSCCSSLPMGLCFLRLEAAAP